MIAVVGMFLGLSVALYFLLKGADFFVQGASVLGRFYRLPYFLIGVIFLGLGTSLPELMAGLFAGFQGSTEFIIANIVGSNIANVFLIGGVLLLFLYKTTEKITISLLDSVFLLLSLLLFLFISVYAQTTVYTGMLLLLLGGVYFFTISSSKSSEFDIVSPNIPYYEALTYLIAGLLVTLIAAKYTVTFSSDIATFFGISVSVVALVIVALGTSLPELAVTFQSVKNNQPMLGFGNIVGSCFFNITLVLGIPALLFTVPVALPNQLLSILLFVSATVLLLLVTVDKVHARSIGIMFLILYSIYILSIWVML